MLIYQWFLQEAFCFSFRDLATGDPVVNKKDTLPDDIDAPDLSNLDDKKNKESRPTALLDMADELEGTVNTESDKSPTDTEAKEATGKDTEATGTTGKGTDKGTGATETTGATGEANEGTDLIAEGEKKFTVLVAFSNTYGPFSKAPTSCWVDSYYVSNGLAYKPDKMLKYFAISVQKDIGFEITSKPELSERLPHQRKYFKVKDIAHGRINFAPKCLDISAELCNKIVLDNSDLIALRFYNDSTRSPESLSKACVSTKLMDMHATVMKYGNDLVYSEDEVNSKMTQEQLTRLIKIISISVASLLSGLLIILLTLYCCLEKKKKKEMIEEEGPLDDSENSIDSANTLEQGKDLENLEEIEASVDTQSTVESASEGSRSDDKEV